MRNSVKVVVDAYNGTVRFFLADPDEPIAAAYARIFPTSSSRSTRCRRSFRPTSAIPRTCSSRRTRRSGSTTCPRPTAGRPTFYNQDDRWAIPEDVTAGGDQPMEPYYVIMRIPGEDAAEFVLIQPMVPEGRPNMIAWVAARMDPGVYGERIAFQFPTGTTTQGPVQIEARINADDAISEQFTLWSNAGLAASFAATCSSFRSARTRCSTSSRSSSRPQGAPFPEFVRVIMADQNRVAFAETVEEGLAQLLGEAEPPPPEEPETVADAGRVAGAVAVADTRASCRPTSTSLVAEASACTPRRRTRWRRGDLGTYQERIDELAEVLDALGRAAGQHPPRLGMDVLVLGSGAREHALAWRLARDEGVRLVRIAPGNGGTRGGRRERPTSTPPIRMAVARHAARERYDLVVIGPEAPLAAGVADELASARIPAFGPTPAAARLESSKAFAKRQMERAGVPTAAGVTFTDPDAAARAPSLASIDRRS